MFDLDVLGVPFGWRRGSGNWRGVSAAIARGEAVQVIQEAGTTLWQKRLPEGHPFTFGFPEPQSVSPQARIWISPSKRRFSPDSALPQGQWHPRVLWVGIGCQRGTSQRLIATAIEQVCQGYHLAEEAIAGLATIDRKADEVGLLAFCHECQLPLKTFCAAMLAEVKVPHPSLVVQQAVGIQGVAEAAALLATQDYPHLLSLLVPKQVVKLEGEPGTVTVAIAQSQREYTGLDTLDISKGRDVSLSSPKISRRGAEAQRNFDINSQPIKMTLLMT